MKVTTIMKDGMLRVMLSGELDHHEARPAMAEIEECIDALLPRDCVLDMSQLSFMDSSGIAVVLKTYKRMKEIGGRLWVENVPTQPMRVLSASGIERIINIGSAS